MFIFVRYMLTGSFLTLGGRLATWLYCFFHLGMTLVRYMLTGSFLTLGDRLVTWLVQAGVKVPVVEPHEEKAQWEGHEVDDGG